MGSRRPGPGDLAAEFRRRAALATADAADQAADNPRGAAAERARAAVWAEAAAIVADHGATAAVEALLAELADAVTAPAAAMLAQLMNAYAGGVHTVVVEAWMRGRNALAQIAGDRVTANGTPGTLVTCPHCGGGGLLHHPDQQPR